MQAFHSSVPARSARAAATPRQPRLRLRALSVAAALAFAAAPQLAAAAGCSFTTGNYSASGCLATLGASDPLSIAPGGYKYLDTTLATLSGGVITATDNLYFVAGNTLNNAGSFRFSVDASLYDNGASGVFVNTGTLAKVGGGGDSHISISGFVNNGGTVNAQTGRLLFDNGGSFNAGSSFTGPGQVLITNGASFAGSFSSDGSLVLAGGTYTGSNATPATLASGTVQWTSSTLAGSWKTASGTTVNVSAGGYKYVGGALTNGGTLAATDNLYFNDASTLTNNGSYQFGADASLYSNGGTNAFVNNGVLAKVAGGGDSHISINGFSNSGTGVVDVQTGQLIFDGGAAFASGSKFTGAGRAIITNGATFTGSLTTANNLYLSGGIVTANDVVATGDVVWTRDTLAGSWKTASGSTLHVDAGGYKYVGGSLTNAGTMTATDNLYFNDGSTLTNNGSYQFAADTGLYSNGGNGSFVNNGVLAKVGGSGDSHINISGFSNAGTGVIDVQTGRVIFDTAASFASGTTISGAGLVYITAGATFNGNLTTASNLYLSGGTVTANNVVATGDVYWTRDTLAGTWKTTSGSTLHVDAGGYKYVGGTLTNAGTMAATDNLYINDTSTLVNNASYQFSNDSGIYGNGGTGSFVNNGTLAKVGGGGDSHISINGFSNSATGVIDVQSGRFIFDNGASFASGTHITGAGQVYVTAGATFNGNLATANNLYLSGGTITANAVVASGDVYWTRDTLAGSWKTASGSTLHVDAGGYKYVGGSLTNAGTMTAGDNLYFNDASTLANNGSYQFAGDAGLYSNGGSNSFVNNGVLAKVSGGGDSHITVNGFTNGATGVIDVQSGRVLFDSGVVLNSGSKLTGAGQVVITNGATLNGQLTTAGNLLLAGGTVTANNVVATGGARWMRDTMTGSWQSANGSALSIEAGGYKYAANLTLGGHTLATDNLYVNPGQALTQNGRYQFDNDVGIYGGGDVVNHGTLVKAAGGGTSDLSNVALQNLGTLEAQTGTLRLPDNFTNAGTLMGVATMQVNGLLTNNGHIAPGSSAATGTLTLAGNLSQGAFGTLDIRLASSTMSDLLQVTGTAAIGGSTLALNCFACMLQNGDTFLLMNSTGALTGTFGGVTTSGFGSGFQYALDYSHPNQVWLDVTNVGAVPEPSSYAMLLGGLGVMGWLVRRRKSAAC